METSLARDLMSDEEWAFFERFILSVRAPNGRKSTNHRRVLDGVFWIARTGAPWRDLPEEFGKWQSIWRLFDQWNGDGTLDRVLQKLQEEIEKAAYLITYTIGCHLVKTETEVERSTQ